jgi:hypothetical protein
VLFHHGRVNGHAREEEVVDRLLALAHPGDQ